MKLLCAGSILVALAACSGSDDDLGSNAVERTYAVPVMRAMEGAIAAVADLSLKVERHEADALGGNLLAHRANGSDVVIAIRSLGGGKSRVTVRVGDGDLALANIVQDQVADRIKKVSQGARLEKRYGIDSPTAFAAARTALKSLGISIATERPNVSIDASREGVPVRIDLASIDPKSTQVTFMVGSVRSAETETLLLQIKQAFESALVSKDRP